MSFQPKWRCAQRENAIWNMIVPGFNKVNIDPAGRGGWRISKRAYLEDLRIRVTVKMTTAENENDPFAPVSRVGGTDLWVHGS